MATEHSGVLPAPFAPPTPWRVTPYPAEFADRYRTAGLWQYATIAASFDRVARAYPDRPALVTAAGTWTYAELATKSDAVAIGLLDAGLQPGETVILQVTNGSYAVAAWYGILKAGLIPVCTLAVHRRHEIEQIAKQTRAAAHLVQADLPSFDLVSFAGEIRVRVPGIRTLLTIGPTADPFAVRIEELAERPVTDERCQELRAIDERADLDAPAVFQLSGGTTGVPKVIPRLHPEYWYNARATAQWWGLTPEDRLAFGLPLVHNAGVANALHAAHSTGAALLLGVPVADRLLPLMAEHRATWVMSPPGLMTEYLEHPCFDDAFRNVRHCVLTAARVPGPLFDALEARGVHVVQAFGMTEGLFLFTPPDASAELRARTVGVPISPFDEVRLLRPGSPEPAGPGETGELCVRGPYSIRGYLHDPDGGSAFTPDGFYRSGDLVRPHDIDGLTAYSVEGRVKDLIDRGGEKVNAQEVERILLNHPDIADAALVGMPDERLGERACAYLVPVPDRTAPTLDELREYLERYGLAKYKWPERVEVVDVLPRTAIGKVYKSALREDIARRLAGG